MELDLNEIRKTIDETDKKLVALFEKRMSLVSLVATYKKEKNLPIFDFKREEIINKKNIFYLFNKKYINYLKDFLKQLVQISRSYQSIILINDATTWQSILGNLPVSEITKNPKVGYSSMIDFYGEMAVFNYFRDSQPICYQAFEEVINGVLDGNIDYGVIPLENTSSYGMLDMLCLSRKSSVYIVGETVVTAERCDKYLKDKPWCQVSCFNTTINTDYAKKKNDSSKVAIASELATEVYGLRMLKENIYNNKKNYIRFGIIKKSMELPGEANKISIDFILDNKQGSLHFIVKTIEEHHLNIIKIESKQIPGTLREYIFFIDFSGNLRDNEAKRALFEIKKNSKKFHFRGNYIENTGG